MIPVLVLSALYRLRGSGANVPLLKWWCAVAFGAMVAVPCIYDYGLIFSLLAFVWATVFSYIAYKIGWDVGPFFGNPPKAKNNFLDFLDIQWLKDYNPLYFCIYRFAVRGLFFGVMLCIATLSWAPLTITFLMPLVYYIGCRILRYRLGWVTDGNGASEYGMGAVMGLFV